MVFINLYWNCYFVLGDDCSHAAALIFNVEGAINNGYTETLPILVSETKIFILLFHVIPETYPPFCINSCFQKVLFNFVIIINSTIV